VTVHDVHPMRLSRDLLLNAPRALSGPMLKENPEDIISDSSFEDDEDASTRAICPKSPSPSTTSVFTTRTTKTGIFM
jgi:hypothetical protein